MLFCFLVAALLFGCAGEIALHKRVLEKYTKEACIHYLQSSRYPIEPATHKEHITL